jgi:hypothetical protein
MTAMSYDERPSPQMPLPARPEVPDGQLHDDRRKPRAVAQLLDHGVLSHVFGQHGEYKVRTTMTTRQAWQYRCCVLRHGKAIKTAFYPITVERKPPRQRDTPKLGDTEDMRLSFAQEAVDIHFTRCAALQEYLVLSAIYDQSPSRSRGWYTLLAPLIGITVLVACGFWSHAFRSEGGPSAGSQPPLVTDQRPTSQSGGLPFPISSSTTSHGSLPEEVVASNSPEPWTPKAVSVNDLFALQGPPPGSDPLRRALPSQASPGSEESGIQVGDMLLLSGWLQRVSRAPDNSYRLHVSPNRDAGKRDLIAMVPQPEKTASSPDVKAQLQTVRTFIKQQLLRQQEPSPRGSMMQRPVYMQLTGQLSYSAAPLAAPARGKRSQAATARWEISPVVEVQFATPSEPSDRSRPQ